MQILTAILNTLTVLTCLFLICLILIQRGKGGGLAGAFGGVGGSSAFGTKAGDVFTRVTMIVASVWIVLSMILVVLYNQGRNSGWNDTPSASTSKEVAPKTTGAKGNTKAKADAAGAGASTPAGKSPASIPASSSTDTGLPAAIPDSATPAKSR